MPLFTLTQKVFVIKCYYKNNEATELVQEALEQQYGRVFGGKNNLAKAINQIVKTFDKTGSVLNRMSYEVPPPVVENKKHVVELVVDERMEVVSVIEGNPDLEEEETTEVVEGYEQPEETTITQEVVDEDFAPEDIIVYEVTKDTDDTERLCKICGESVKRKDLWKHRKTHEPPKPEVRYNCDQCEKVYRNKNDLINHVKVRHTGDYVKIICEICGKVSTNKFIHKSHMLVHSEEKPYECTECPMKFVRRQALRKHVMTHTGERPLSCKECGDTFAAHMSLTMHMRLHTGERPYECEHCQKRFIGRPALNAHLKQRHREEYNHVCGICGGRFKTEKTLKDHIGKKHNIDQLL